MTRHIYALIIVSLLFIYQPSLVAQPSDQDAEYLKLVKEYTLNQDGSYDFHYRKEIKLLTHFSFHRLYGETFIVYNPQYQQLKFNEAYTIMADGKKVVVPENAYNEVLPAFARDVAAYNNLREMVVTHTGTEVGAVITLDYTLHTDSGFLPFFFGMEEIGEQSPVKDMEVIVHTPIDVPLQYRMLNNRTATEITEANGQSTYRWKVVNLPANPRSSNQDPERKPVLQFSIAKDMTFAFFSFVNQPVFKESLGADAQKRAEAVVKDKTDDLDKILALQALVIDEVKLADIPLAYTGYKARTPQQVWQSANATQLEKTVLLSRMLVAIGINAYPVATTPNGWFSQSMGNPALFENYLVQVNPKKSGRLYLSVTQKQAQNYLYDLADKTIILLDPNMESMRTFQEKPEANLLMMDADLELAEDKKLSGSLELKVEGIVNPYFKLLKDSSYVKTMIAGEIPASQMGKPEITGLSELKTNAVIAIQPATLKTDLGGYIFIDLPRFKTGFDTWNLPQFMGTGTTPIKLDHPLRENYSYKIETPTGFSMVTPPVDITFKNVLGELQIRISQKGNVITINRSWEMLSDVVTSENLDAFREMVRAWEDPKWRRIVLKAISPKYSDSPNSP